MSKYIIISGTNKAGTTSLFDYLAAHPEVKASYIKQTFFFLDKEWQKKLDLNSLYNYENGFEEFYNYFPGQDEGYKYNLEASPEYLYAPNTPSRISDFFKLHEGKVIIILREPVSRFNSLFYFGKQQGLIPEGMNYKNFYNESIKYEEGSNTCLMAYKTGFYAEFLKRYVDKFGDDLIVLFFEDLIRDPRSFMYRLSKYLEIDSSFYNKYNFGVNNRTISIKNHTVRKIYDTSRKFYIKYFYRNKIGIWGAAVLRNVITPLYKKTNFVSLKKEVLDSDIIDRLKSDYKEDKLKIELLLNIKAPW